jgi:starch-binding outer membrane protein, SusD/RagB family
MKKFTTIIILSILCIFTFTECEKQLELSPLGQLDENTFYQTENDFEAASLSPYSTVLNFYYDQSGLGWYQGVLYPDDDVTAPNNGSNDQEDFNWNPNNDQFTYLWEQSYKGIQRANVIIDRLPLAKQFSDAAKKARFEAEAKFLRAYFHFLLAIHFGNPPVSDKAITTVSEARKGNSQPGEIWDLIINDLQYAKANLPADWDAKNKGRVTSGAASGMLGKVYLYRAQWEKNPSFYSNAITEFNSIVASGKYILLPEFEENFNPNTENTQESLFEIQFTRGDFNPWLPTDFGADGDQNIGAAGTARNIFWRPSCGPGNVCAPGANGMGYGQVHITLPLQNEFEPNDPRIANTYWRAGDDFLGEPYNPAWSVTGSTPAKYVRQNLIEFSFPLNIEENNDRIIRYADVLLMLAEAELLGNNNVEKAAQLINQVRRRADPTGTILPDRPATVDKNQMFGWLQHERRVELALEGNRYNDLVRWHRAGLINIKTDINFGRTAANQNWSEKHLLKPIPQRELDLNSNLVQNPLY